MYYITDKNHPVSDLQKKMKKYELIIIKNFFEKSSIINQLSLLRNHIKSKKIIKISGKNFYKRKNYFRLDCGDYSQVNARFNYMLALFEWNKSFFFKNELKKIIEFRDNLLNLKKKKNFTYSIKNKNFFNLRKVLFYPSGGGFMNGHKDSYNNDGFPNFLLCINERKKSSTYQEGGGYYIFNNEKFFDAEKYLEPGDLYFHSTKTTHGVKAIDPHKKIYIDNFNSGRWVINLSIEKVIIK